MQAKMTFIDETGKQIECSIVAMFKNNDQKYIAYTTEEDDRGEKNLLVSKYIMDNDIPHLIPIENEDEWKFANEYLDREVFGGDDEFDD